MILVARLYRVGIVDSDGAADRRRNRWSIDYCQNIVDVYPPRRTEVALTAIELWEKAPQVDSNLLTLDWPSDGEPQRHANCQSVSC